MNTRFAMLCLLASLSACLGPPPVEPAPTPATDIPTPSCLFPVEGRLAQLATDEAERIASGGVAPLEHGREFMNEGDMKLIRWAAAWGLLNRGLREGAVPCEGALILEWAESRFRAVGAEEPRPTGHGHNALRRVTAGWGPLPLEEAADMGEGDYHSTLLYMGNVIDAYLEPGGPYYLGQGRWIPPPLAP